MKDPLYNQTPIAKRLGKGVDATLYPLPFKKGGKMMANGGKTDPAKPAPAKAPNAFGQGIPERRMNTPYTPGIISNWKPVSKAPGSGETTYENVGFGRSSQGRTLESPFTRNDLETSKAGDVSQLNRSVFKYNRNATSIQEGDILRQGSNPLDRVDLKDEVAFVTMKAPQDKETVMTQPKSYLPKPKMNSTYASSAWGRDVNKEMAVRTFAESKVKAAKNDIGNLMKSDAYNKQLKSGNFINEDPTPINYVRKTPRSYLE